MKNAVVWFEVMEQDTDKLKNFYGELFSWPLQKFADEEYFMMSEVDKGIPGGVGRSPDENKAGWTTFYVEVEDVAGTLERAKKAGASIMMPETKTPAGLVLGMFTDPEGHPVGLIKARA